MPAILSAIATDIGHAERILSSRRTRDGEWTDGTDPVLCELVADLCDTLRAAGAVLVGAENKERARIVAKIRKAAHKAGNHAGTMRGLPNDIARASGEADGLHIACEIANCAHQSAGHEGEDDAALPG